MAAAVVCHCVMVVFACLGPPSLLVAPLCFIATTQLPFKIAQNDAMPTTSRQNNTHPTRLNIFFLDFLDFSRVNFWYCYNKFLIFPQLIFNNSIINFWYFYPLCCLVELASKILITYKLVLVRWYSSLRLSYSHCIFKTSNSQNRSHF